MTESIAFLNLFIKSEYATFRCSHQRCSVKKSVFENFPIFTGKHQHDRRVGVSLDALEPSPQLFGSLALFNFCNETTFLHISETTFGKFQVLTDINGCHKRK